MKIQIDAFYGGEDVGSVLIELEEGGVVGFNFNEEYFSVDINELFSSIEVLKQLNDKSTK